MRHKMRVDRCFLIQVLAQAALTWNIIKAADDLPGHVESEAGSVKSAPRDYAFSVDGSRVRDLASFFESMRKKEYEVSDDTDQNVIITQSEAASKLHTLSYGLTLEEKCSKYIKLITKPNIRTYAAVNLLMHEDRMFEDIEQASANLESRLTNERNFNALGKLQSIIQTLESEKSNMKSSFTPEVQKDLLDCMSYYIYRHQRGVLGLTDYIQASQVGVLHLVGNMKETDVINEKLVKLVDEVKLVEAKEEELGVKSSRVWLEEISRLYQVLIDNKLLELPHIVLDFITSEKRLKRLSELETNSKLVFQDNKHPEKLSFIHSANPEVTAKQNEISDLILTNSDQLKTTSEPQEANLEPGLSVDISQATNNDPNPADFVETLIEPPQTGNEPVTEISTNPELDKSANSCEQLLALFDEYLHTISWNNISIEQSKSFAVLINRYKVDCFSNPDQQSDGSIHWSFVSIRKKLVTRSLQELERISLAQLSVSDVLRLLNY